MRLLALFFLTRSLPRLSTGFTDRFQPLAPPLLAYLQRPGLLASVGMLLFFAYVAGFSELIGSWLVVLGLLTPFGALALTSTMAMAALQHILTAGLNIDVLELVVLHLGAASQSCWWGPVAFPLMPGLSPPWSRPRTGMPRLALCPCPTLEDQAFPPSGWPMGSGWL